MWSVKVAFLHRPWLKWSIKILSVWSLSGCLMSLLCFPIRHRNSCAVSPTYCSPHFRQVKRYITFEELQPQWTISSGITDLCIRCVEELTIWTLMESWWHIPHPSPEAWRLIFVWLPEPHIFSRLSTDVEGHLEARAIADGREVGSWGGRGTNSLLGTLRLQFGFLPKCIWRPRLPLTDRLQTLHCLLGEVTGISLDEWGTSGEVLGGMLSAPEHMGRKDLVDASGWTNLNLLRLLLLTFNNWLMSRSRNVIEQSKFKVLREKVQLELPVVESVWAGVFVAVL